MRSFERTNDISELLNSFVRTVKIHGALNYTDPNREAQNVLASLLSMVFGWSHLRNLDVTERKNYPGIDLADDNARIAVQVTSDAGGPKVRETLEKFANHKLHEKYDRVIIYILTEKLGKYVSDFSGIVPAPFHFDKTRDILDYKDLLRPIKALSPDKQQQVLDLLEDEFGDEGWSRYVLSRQDVKKHEEVYVPPVQLVNALSILHREGIVILIGPPHIGKTETAIELLLRVAKEKRYGSVLRIEEFNNWKRLSRIRQRAILLDDAFGNLDFDKANYGKHFDELRKLALENLIVITSRHDIFETARTKTRMGESGTLSKLTVELTSSSAYDTNALRQVLEKHVHYERTYAMLKDKPLSTDNANLLLSEWQLIVSRLRFPHNLERLVNNASGKLHTLHDLLRLIEEAKDIVGATALWYNRQEEALRVFVAVIALYPSMLTSDMQEAYRLTCNKRGIPVDDVERKTRETAGHVRADGHVAFEHPSYEEGINRALRGESSSFIKHLLEARSEYLLSKPLLFLLQYRRENNKLEEEEFVFQRSPSSQAITFEMWFKDYVRAYNRIISRDFPNMRTAFYPNWNGTSRIYAFATPEGELDCWAHLQQFGNEAEVTMDQEPAALQQETRADIEQAAWQTHTGPSVVWHHYPSSTHSVPQIAALNEVIKQIASPLGRSSFKKQAFLSESWHLRMARLLMALESAGFPMESISISNPLTGTRLEEWANPYFQEPIPFHLFLNGPRMEISVDRDQREINDLGITLAADEIKILETEGHPVTGELLVPPDLTLETCPQYRAGTYYDHLYTDQRLIEAAKRGLQLSFGAYKETVERSFPTLYNQMQHYTNLPVEIVIVLNKETLPYDSTRNITYAVKRVPDNTKVDAVQVRIFSTSEQVSPEEREAAIAMRGSIWNRHDPNLLYGGTHRADEFVKLKDWYNAVISMIITDFDQLVNERFEGIPF